MIKRVLVALDPDADTPVATRHAIRIAQKHDASLTGLAIVDAGPVEPEPHDSPLGSVHQTNAIQESLTTEAQKRAVELLEAFEEIVGSAGVDYEEHVRQGMPFNRIVEEMRFHDLLVLGETPHFLYSRPQQRTKTLARIVRDTLTPTFIVREDREPPVTGVVAAFDGGDSSTHALHAFAQLRPFGTEVDVTLLHVHDDLPEASERLLKQAQAYLQAHGFEATAASVDGRTPHEEINTYVKETGADVVVAGAHSVSKLRQLAFGSNTAPLLKHCPAALFLHQ